MRRRQILIGLAAVAGAQIGACSAVFAAGLVDQIVADLRKQGFGNFEIERTWLGRTRILAERNNARREIILNPNTGEILRDLWLSKTGQAVQGARINDDDGRDGDNSGNGGGDDGHEDEPDEPDEPEDDDESDHSGSGGGSD